MGALVLMFLGACLALGSFVFAAFHMTFSGKRGFISLFGGHLGAMIGMAIGVLMFWGGSIWVISLLF